MDESGKLLTNAVRSWMESVVDKALNELEKDGDKYLLVKENKIYKVYASVFWIFGKEKD